MDFAALSAHRHAMAKPLGQPKAYTAATDELIACPRCDALHRAAVPPPGRRARCTRCRTVLIAPRGEAMLSVVWLAVAALALMSGVVFLPFLGIRSHGLGNDSTVLGAAAAFAGGAMFPLAVAVVALIVLVPTARMLLTLWALAPLALGRPPLPGAHAAFRLDEELRPWSMAEIFVIGVAVAMVKIADLATIEIGSAFWLFAALIVVIALQDGLKDRWSIWRALETSEGWADPARAAASAPGEARAEARPEGGAA